MLLMITHEQYIATIRDLILNRVSDSDLRTRLAAAKVVYGTGMPGTRGTTYYATWESGGLNDLIEICANGEESWLQLVGTTLHEAAHVLAGPGHGHGAAWKASAHSLGLRVVKAAGQLYAEEHFDEAVLSAVKAIPTPTDGAPRFGIGAALRGRRTVAPRPCPLGIGVRGGRSRGQGSGSRLRLWHCACPVPVKVRIASDDFQAHCDRCASPFCKAV